MPPEDNIEEPDFAAFSEQSPTPALHFGSNAGSSGESPVHSVSEKWDSNEILNCPNPRY